MTRPVKHFALGLLLAVGIAALPTTAGADIPPAAEPSSTGVDWVYLLTGVIFAFAGGLLFVWLGRKLLKR